MSTTSVQDKVILITGGTKGIGHAIAQRLSRTGARIVLNYSHDSAAAKAALSSLELPASHTLLVRADASSPEEMRALVRETVSKFGRIDTLVLNAGTMPLLELTSLTESTFDSTFALNVKGPLFLTQAALPHMGPGSRVVFISTAIARNSGVPPSYGLYASTKGAIEQLTRVLAKDLGRKGITVNAVAPGPTDTELFREGKTEAMIKGIASASPFNRLATPAEIAEVVAFVASPESSWVSGQIISANGASFV
jgi:3-oxoacyl-[acyl-carrier protein] reductase